MTHAARPSVLQWIGLLTFALGLGGALIGALFGLLLCFDGHARLSGAGDAFVIVGGWSLLLGIRGLVAGAVLGLIVGAVRLVTYT